MLRVLHDELLVVTWSSGLIGTLALLDDCDLVSFRLDFSNCCLCQRNESEINVVYAGRPRS
jgi:hypothetical protein